MALTQKQIDNVQIDYGIVIANYGEIGAERLGPSRGGGEFTADGKIRDIEYDGMKGKTMGMQVYEEINASLKVTLLDTSISTLALAMPYAQLDGDGTTTPYSLTCGSASIGTLQEGAYLKNVTMFCKTIGGKYKAITLYNAMHEGSFGFKAAPKGEGEVELEFNAHWDVLSDEANLYKIEDIEAIVEPVV